MTVMVPVLTTPRARWATRVLLLLVAGFLALGLTSAPAVAENRTWGHVAEQMGQVVRGLHRRLGGFDAVMIDAAGRHHTT